ncbi:ribosome biogenesis GTP-binding protein YihA/YsxC [Mycoplasmopsis iners]|uniref:ribosome biogenesis GTP-binding protein YihA/YsxC n=1 Tax=Mycoplasmopsis iners TaxID=76630 RepID=UPI000496611F|nr:ribosome biogenesis GTP-binding protein YihA/YsxC [Mycoplasmopsis iners]
MWKFLKSATNKSSWIKTNEIQVCLWGRSNVGKSSLLNALIGQNISFVSKNPGRTQLINYFEDNNGKLVVDLPGYGFANMSKEAQVKMINNIKSFLTDTSTKKYIFLLIDSRTGITKTDVEYLAFLRSLNWPISLVYTKLDKLNQKEKAQLIKQIDSEIAEGNLMGINEIFTISSKTGRNMNELVSFIDKVLYGENYEE